DLPFDERFRRSLARYRDLNTDGAISGVGNRNGELARNVGQREVSPIIVEWGSPSCRGHMQRYARPAGRAASDKHNLRGVISVRNRDLFRSRLRCGVL